MPAYRIVIPASVFFYGSPMNASRFTHCFLLAVIATTYAATNSATTVQADDWPQYRGPAGNGKSSESLSSDGTASLKPAWKVPTPKGFSSFAVAEGRCFTLIVREDDQRNRQATVVAMNADNGKEIWATPLRNDIYQGGGNAGAKGNKGGDGPRATPTVSDGLVYVYDAVMTLHCLDAKTGKRVWKKDIAKDFNGKNITWGSASSPIVVDDKVLVSGGGPGQSFLAFDKKTGRLVWQTGDERFTHATPTLTEINGLPQVIFLMQSGPISINPDDGSERWRTNFDYNVSTAASPVVTDDLVYMSAGYKVGALLLKVLSGDKTEDVWFKERELMNHWSTPVIHQGHIYGLFGFKDYGTAPLQCVELETGIVKWSSPGYGQGNCILVGDQLVVLSDTGEVAIVAANPSEYTEITKADVLDGKCWSTPAYSDGKLYIRSTVEGACIKL
jgi:outer membrane protein assembly factor BamB